MGSFLHPRHRIDASWLDASRALIAGAKPCRRPGPLAADGGPALVCLSVRSAFDLVLTALDLPVGDEVLVSAVTHPDMVRIIELHGLRPVPVDIDPWTLAPIGAALRAAMSPRTRVILVAHLFGSRVDLDGVIDLARERKVLVVEDCAQSIDGPADRGDPRADISLFSFGFIKTATALGGALAWVRDPVLATRMRNTQRRWPVQSRPDYGARALKCLVALLLSRPRLYWVVARTIPDPGTFFRTVPHGDHVTFLRWLRRRPCAPLVTVLAR